MIKSKSATVPFFLYNPTDGRAATGASSISIYVSLDGLTPVRSNNSAVEVDSTNSPGIYRINLTASEMNADVIVLTFSHAQYAAMPLTIVTAEQFPTVAQIKSGLSTLTTDDIPTVAQIQSGLSRLTTADIPTVAQIQSGLSTLTTADIPTVAQIQSGLSTLTTADIPTVAQIQFGLSTLTAADIPTANQIADTTLSRSVSNVETSASEHSLTTMVLGALESKFNNDSTWTIYRTDGQTIYVTKTIETNSTAKPITGVN